MKSMLKALSVMAALAAMVLAQTPAGYIDSYIVKVKPEKRTDFDAVARKIAEANRKHKGDNWIAYATEYGEQNTVMFSSVRESYSDIDKASDAFMKAMKEGYGPNFMKLFQDANNCTISSRAEVRRRRPDLSWNVPSDTAAIQKYVGESKWLRFLTVRIRPGRTADYEESVKSLKAALEKSPTRRPTFVSQVVAGRPIGTYIFSSYGKALGDFDIPTGNPTLRELMGSEAYERYQKAGIEDTSLSEWTIARIMPELSNPTDGIASAAPDFWRPKPAAAPKPKAAPPAKTGE
jgi:hypothetical protein